MKSTLINANGQDVINPQPHLFIAPKGRRCRGEIGTHRHPIKTVWGNVPLWSVLYVDMASPAETKPGIWGHTFCLN